MSAPAPSFVPASPSPATPTALLTAKPGGHLVVLDGLRGTIVFIMLMHFNRMPGGEGLIQNLYLMIARMGFVTLDIFFVVSGFLITGILLDAKGREGFFRTFYVRRALRIFPLYYAFLLVWFFVLPMTQRNLALFDTPFADKLALLTYTTNIRASFVPGSGAVSLGHLWSLAVEEQFYMLWPLVVCYTDRRRFKHVCLALIVLAPVVRFALAYGSLGVVAALKFTPARVDSLALGALLATFVREPAGLGRFIRPAWVVGTLAALLAVFVYWRTQFSATNQVVLTLGTWSAVWMAASLTLLALTGSLGRIVGAVLRSGPFVSMGKYCYAIYVFHLPLGTLLFYHGVRIHWFRQRLGSAFAGQLVYSAVLIAASYLLALASWNLFEKHFLKAKRLFPYARG